MAKLHDQWTVLPHGPLAEVEPGLLTVVGQIPMPLGNFPRRMTVVGLSGKRTAIFSPFPLDEPGMERIEALGSAAYLIVPNAYHRLDLKPFHARYPKAKIVTALAAKAKVEEAVKPVQTEASLGDSVQLRPIAGEAELALLVRHGKGASLITNDIIGNVGHPHGPGAWIMSRLMHFGPKPQITRAAKHLVKGKAELAAQLRDWAAIEGLKRIIPSHGDIIHRPQRILESLAESLDKRGD